MYIPPKILFRFSFETEVFELGLAPTLLIFTLTRYNSNEYMKQLTINYHSTFIQKHDHLTDYSLSNDSSFWYCSTMILTPDCDGGQAQNPKNDVKYILW
jgi:hypothetical protein